MMTDRYAVMGNPVEHSLSPIIHALFGTQTGRILSYEKILIDLLNFEQQVKDFFDQGGKGLNITLPCKQRAFALADQVTTRCATARAANTLWQNANGLQADNTDGIGLLCDLTHYIDLTDKQILVLGAGGAARGILAPLLASNPAQLTMVNRTMDKARALCADFVPTTCCSLAELNGPFDLIINATSASITGQNIMLPSSIIKPTTVCYDLAYQRTRPTPFVIWGRSQGCVAVDGLGMLVEQAAEAFAIWHGVKPEVKPVLDYLREGGRSVIPN